MFLQRIGSGQRLKYPSSNGSQEATTESWRREWLEGYQMVMFLFNLAEKDGTIIVVTAIYNKS